MGKWLVKSEPETYSISDLKRDKSTRWDGVRNALAAIHLRGMRKGDSVLVYHSVKEKAVVGIAEVAKEAYPDPTDSTGKSVCIDLKFTRELKQPITLAQIKSEPKLKDIGLVRMSRLSVMPVTDEQWKLILAMEA